MMKSLITVALFVAVLFAVAAFGQSDEINIIPKPAQVRVADGSFALDRNTKLFANSGPGKKIAQIFNEYLQGRYGYKLKFVKKRPERGFISFEQFGAVPNVEPNAERYQLAIDPDHARILGEANGLFYGFQTLIQLMPATDAKSITLRSLEINDEPRFKYRGMHLDVARHFFPVSFVKKYIDLLAQYKFNYFHWHLTDDQGWRIEIKKYPKLTEIGSKRSESHEGPYSTIFKGDGRPVEGFYTQEQIKEVVAYAKARYITVVPEIELPGHASAALAAYPELGNGCATPNYKFEVKKTWGIFKEVFCPTDETFKFLEDVIDETIALFPDSPYVHIGGDEVLKDYWKESQFVQELKKRENLKDEHEVQSYFVQRIEKHVNKRGKKIIGWDEILEGGLAPNATVMSWRGMKGGIEAAKSKHDVIMTPTDFAYLDYGQGDPAYELLNIGGYLPLEKVYQFDPMPKELSADEQKYILGGQANLWTEYIETGDKLEYMAFPRMLAIAESVWSRPENKNFADFKRRLAANLPMLDRQNVNYRIPEPEGLQNVVTDRERTLITLSPIAGMRVHYTIDGSTPDERSPQYSQPIEIMLADSSSATLKTIVINAVGRKSVVYTATIVRGAMLEPATVGETKPGVTYSLVVPKADLSPDPAVKMGETRSIFLNQFEKQIDLKQLFGVQYDGYLKVAQDGVYELQVDSTWDATLVLGDKMVINEAGTKDRKMRSVIVPLRTGLHKISLRYNHRGGDAHFRFRVGIKGQGLRQINGGELVH